MKIRKQISIEEETLARFTAYAEHTNRSLAEFLIEAGEQMMRRYAVEKTKSLKEELTTLMEKTAELYQFVRK